jgi:hypothetical protein
LFRISFKISNQKKLEHGKNNLKKLFLSPPSPILRKIKTQKTQIEDFEKIEI